MFVSQIVSTLEAVLRDESTGSEDTSASTFITLHEPRFAGREWDYVRECLDTGWVSSVGKFVDEFEKRLAQFCGVNFAIATVNGTAALHICLQLAGVGRDDEVLIPSLSFVATSNAVAYCGAVPHFCDSEETTLGLDAEKLQNHLQQIATRRGAQAFNTQSGRRLAAVVPMHTFGHPVNLDALRAVCDEWNLPLIEDAAEALGSYYKGRHVGGDGLLSALSFNGNKIITTGGGGAILTNDETLARRAKHLTTTAKVPHRWEFVHDEIGYNYRLPNLNAALGCAQLEQMPQFLKNKRALAVKYLQAFETIDGASVVREPENSRSNYWLNALLLDEAHAKYLQELLQDTNESNLMTRPVWTPLHQLPMYENCPRMKLDVAQSLATRLLNIPSSAKLGE